MNITDWVMIATVVLTARIVLVTISLAQRRKPIPADIPEHAIKLRNNWLGSSIASLKLCQPFM